MKRESRIAFNGFTRQIATLNGVPSATEKFTVEPSVQQRLETRTQEKSEFLKRINMIGVTEQKGEKIGLGVSGPVASTTDTTTTDRGTRDVTTLDADLYECTQTNFDTHITYQKIDLWAKFGDFQNRIRDAILERQALDRIMIGWNGVSRATTSDRVANPLLQDVNIGWLQKYRANAPARVMAEGVPASGVIKVGTAAGHDYTNLDALVFDATNELIDPWYRESTDLVVICGRELLADKYFPLVDADQPPSEQIAADLILSQKRMGGLQAIRVPFFPADKLMITFLSNLSLYWQIGGRRRTIVDNAKRDRIENYESSNDAYVIEEYGAGCLIENIALTW